jgi:hypothetical protein
VGSADFRLPESLRFVRAKNRRSTSSRP